jgi:hypothetical protein
VHLRPRRGERFTLDGRVDVVAAGLDGSRSRPIELRVRARSVVTVQVDGLDLEVTGPGRLCPLG